MNQNTAVLSDKGIIEISYVGDQSSEIVAPMVEQAITFARQLRDSGKPVLVLVNLEQIGHSTSSSREATINGLKNADYDKIAIFGGKVFIRKLASLLVNALHLSDKVKLVNDKAAAEAWLLNDSQPAVESNTAAQGDLAAYQKHVQEKLAELQSLIGSVAVGEYPEEYPLPDENDEFNEVFVGVQVLIENLQEKIRILRQSSQNLGAGVVQLHSAARTLGTQNQQYEEIFQAVTEGLLVTDDQNKIILMNPAASAHLKTLLSQSGVPMSSGIELVDDSGAVLGKVLNQSAAEGALSAESKTLNCHLRHNGTIIGAPFQVLVGPIMEGEKHIGSVLILHS